MDVQHLGDVLTSLFQNRKRRTLYLGAILILLFLGIRFFSASYLVTIPVSGGGFSEGMVGYPRFVNPVLALSQTDKDLSRLVFSGLFTENNQGKIIPDLVDSYSVNASSTEYTIVLRKGVTFHDGSPLTTRDVDFTYNLIRDPVVKSHLAPTMETVDWDVIDPYTMVFTLQQPNQHFVELLTVGILSFTQWENTSLEEFPFAVHNISPIGSGPFAITDVNRNSDERITSYLLTAHPGYKQVYIESIEVKFFENHSQVIAAFESGLIDNLGNISPQELLLLDHALETKNIQSYPLDRSFVLFMNQEQHPIFADQTISQAIDQSINRSKIITDVLFERGDIAVGPLARTHPFYIPHTEEPALTTQLIKESFESLGYTKNPDGLYTNSAGVLDIVLHTPDVVELVKVAKIIKEELRTLGLSITIVPVDQAEIINSTIRRREYQMLLFGVKFEQGPHSLENFWHSDKILDPGKNISMYSNKTVDAILERLTDSPEQHNNQVADYENLQKEIRRDMPVIFLYHPHFIYAMDEKISNAQPGDLHFAWDRFNDIEEWYIQTESLLPFFIP